jgi:uncharacterized MAPEG superfamily protein
MSIFAGSIEIQMLCWSVALGLIQLVIVTVLAIKDQGPAYNISARDAAPPPVSVITARLQRAFGNYRETFVYFAVAVLVVTLLNKTNPTTALGAQLYFWARLVYVPIYAAGLAGVRTAVWTVSFIGLVMVFLGALV